MENKSEAVISVCGHLGLCMQCAKAINKCPICRKPFDPNQNLIKVYRC